MAHQEMEQPMTADYLQLTADRKWKIEKWAQVSMWQNLLYY